MQNAELPLLTALLKKQGKGPFRKGSDRLLEWIYNRIIIRHRSSLLFLSLDLVPRAVATVVKKEAS